MSGGSNEKKGNKNKVLRLDLVLFLYYLNKIRLLKTYIFYIVSK